MAELACDVAIIGGGPAGLAAAVTAAEHGARVVLVDESQKLGGQIWREDIGVAPRPARPWLRRLAEAKVEILSDATVWQVEPGFRLLTGRGEVRAEQVVLACGSRERFLPFPGWTKEGVLGAGGIQALAHSGLEVRDRRIVIAGSGPLLLQVASRLSRDGARVLRIAEQADPSRLATLPLFLGARKLLQAMTLADYRFRWSSWPIEAEGSDRLEAVRLQVGKRQEVWPCDYLAVAFGLVANLEVARALGCATEEGAVRVSSQQRTSVEGVLAAGEVCGVKGGPGALADGVCAGYVAAGETPPARWLRRRDKERRFGARLHKAFALREEVRHLGRSDTEICRCEHVSLGAVGDHADWNSAKLHTRCGMGLCQARICGVATETIFGWGPGASRPPLVPTSIGDMLTRGSTGR